MTDMEGIIDNLITPDDWVPVDSIIKVIGVGGGGCNAVDYMYRQKIEGCTFIVCNTDSQALDHIDVPVKIQLGSGLGAGCDPTKGRNAALDSQDVIGDFRMRCGVRPMVPVTVISSVIRLPAYQVEQRAAFL